MRRLLSVLLALLALPAASSAAATFSVTPTRVVLNAKTASTLLTITNDSAEALRVQVSVHAWGQSVSGEMQLARTEDVVAFPGLFSLAAGETRKVRVAHTAGTAPLEKAYRIYVEELAHASSSGETAVRMLTRLGIPIFVRPDRPNARAELREVGVRDGRLMFTLTNTGNVFFIPDRVRVRAFTASGEPVNEQAPTAWYVLAGGSRAFEIAYDPAACRRVRRVLIEVQIGDVLLKSPVETAAGICGP